MRVQRGRDVEVPYEQRDEDVVIGKSHTQGGLVLGSASWGLGGALAAVDSWKSQLLQGRS